MLSDDDSQREIFEAFEKGAADKVAVDFGEEVLFDFVLD